MDNKVFKHQECLKGELFLKNMSLEDFNNLPFTTKRKGIQSFDGIGNKLNVKNWFPVFINEEELQISKYNIADIRKELIS